MWLMLYAWLVTGFVVVGAWVNSACFGDVVDGIWWKIRRSWCMVDYSLVGSVDAM